MKLTKTIEFSLGTDNEAEALETISKFIKHENAGEHSINGVSIKVAVLDDEWVCTDCGGEMRHYGTTDGSKPPYFYCTKCRAVRLDK